MALSEILAETPEAAVPTVTFNWMRHRKYVVGMLFLVYFLNSIDRNIITILQQSIKAEYHLLDWQLGIMTGFAFAFFYTAIGLPVARVIDGGANRTVIVSAALALWSLMTALCGVTVNYWQLLLCRAGVGVGEGSFAPATLTLASDYFRKNERAKAMGTYLMGLPISSLVGLALGGWVAQHYGWRSALMLVGLPGLAVALLFKLTVKEPPRGLADGKPTVIAAQAPIREVLRVAGGKKTFTYLLIAAAFASFGTVGGIYWFPPFMMRAYGLNTAQIGLWWGGMIGVAGIASNLGGGYLADWFGSRDPKYYMLLPAGAMALSLPFFLLAASSHNVWLAFGFFAVPAVLNNSWIAPALALSQGLAPLAMRALLGMIITFAANMVGHGLAPPIIGGLSDLFGARAGEVDGLRWALIVSSINYPIAAFFFVRASRTIAADLEI